MATAKLQVGMNGGMRMAIIKRCDKCGKIYERGGFISMYMDGAVFCSIDLCRECRDKLKGWVKNNGEW